MGVANYRESPLEGTGKNLENGSKSPRHSTQNQIEELQGESRDFEPSEFRFGSVRGFRDNDLRRIHKTAFFTGDSKKTNKARRKLSTGFLKDGQVARSYQKIEVEAAQGLATGVV